MSDLSEIITDIGTGYDEARAIFFPGVSLELLAVSDTANQFETIETIDSGWFLEYSEFRSSFRLSIATADTDFSSLINRATHVRIGEDVYVIRAADTTPPAGNKLVWQLLCDRELKRSNFRSRY